jgi:predicted nucleic acid-binding protein
VAELLVDTDVCIDHLEGTKRLPRRGRLGYSVITRAELLAGDPMHHAAIRRLLAGTVCGCPTR